jgi:hypothetical protein
MLHAPYSMLNAPYLMIQTICSMLNVLCSMLNIPCCHDTPPIPPPSQPQEQEFLGPKGGSTGARKISARPRALRVTVRRGRYSGKLGAKDSSRTARRRSKAAAELDRMAQCRLVLGDPRDQMSLEEKKRLALFYYFQQVVRENNN